MCGAVGGEGEKEEQLARSQQGKRNDHGIFRPYNKSADIYGI